MYYVGSNDFSAEWIGVTGIQIDSRVTFCRIYGCCLFFLSLSPPPFKAYAYGDGNNFNFILKHFTNN